MSENPPSELLEKDPAVKKVWDLLDKVSGVVDPVKEIQEQFERILDEVNAVNHIIASNEATLNQMVMSYLRYYDKDLCSVNECDQIVARTIRILKEIYLQGNED